MGIMSVALRLVSVAGIAVGGNWVLSGGQSSSVPLRPSNTCKAIDEALSQARKGFVDIIGPQITLEDANGVTRYATRFIFPDTYSCTIFKFDDEHYVSHKTPELSCSVIKNYGWVDWVLNWSDAPAPMQTSIEPCLAKLGGWSRGDSNGGWLPFESAKTGDQIELLNYSSGDAINFLGNGK